MLSERLNMGGVNGHPDAGRRGKGRDEAIFRAAIDRILEVAEKRDADPGEIFAEKYAKAVNRNGNWLNNWLPVWSLHYEPTFAPDGDR
jgi:hypothetical protein